MDFEPVEFVSVGGRDRTDDDSNRLLAPEQGQRHARQRTLDSPALGLTSLGTRV
jgi:hypothetical protein